MGSSRDSLLAPEGQDHDDGGFITHLTHSPGNIPSLRRHPVNTGSTSPRQTHRNSASPRAGHRNSASPRQQHKQFPSGQRDSMDRQQGGSLSRGQTPGGGQTIGSAMPAMPVSSSGNAPWPSGVTTSRGSAVDHPLPPPPTTQQSAYTTAPVPRPQEGQNNQQNPLSQNPNNPQNPLSYTDFTKGLLSVTKNPPLPISPGGDNLRLSQLNGAGFIPSSFYLDNMKQERKLQEKQQNGPHGNSVMHQRQPRRRHGRGGLGYESDTGYKSDQGGYRRRRPQYNPDGYVSLNVFIT